jgi:hypothetical protein
MRVTTISAAVRYSADTGHGSWKTLELGAEATIDSNENWTVALSCLYDTLVSQFRAKWQNGPTQPAAAPANGQQGDPAPHPPKGPLRPSQGHQSEISTGVRPTRSNTSVIRRATRSGTRT